MSRGLIVLPYETLGRLFRLQTCCQGVGLPVEPVTRKAGKGRGERLHNCAAEGEQAQLAWGGMEGGAHVAIERW